MDQVTYLHWSIGQPQYYCPCHSIFGCDSPYATTIGAEPMMEHDTGRASQLVKESGYDGAPGRSPSHDRYPVHERSSDCCAPALRAVGFKVILKGMDWPTTLAVRSSKEPPRKGGWNLAPHMVAGGGM